MLRTKHFAAVMLFAAIVAMAGVAQAFSADAAVLLSVCSPDAPFPDPCFQNRHEGGANVSSGSVSLSLSGAGSPAFPGLRIAEGRARADLSTGELGVFVMAQGPVDSFGTSFTGASALARLTDTVFLHVSPSITGNFIVRVNASVTGSITGDDLGGNARNRSFLQMDITEDTRGGVQPAPFAIFRRLSDAPFTAFFDIPVAFDPVFLPAPFFHLTTTMNLGDGGFGSRVTNATADFFGTAALSLELPPGVTFTSESGVFLAQQQQPPPTAVPEPSILALLGLGLLGAAGFRRRRSPK